MKDNIVCNVPADCAVVRVALWDNIKFLMIIFMVVGHFADVFTARSAAFKSIFLFIYAFHMPSFIFMSGLFYSRKDEKRKIVYYVSCGFALKIFMTVIRLVLNKSAGFALLSDGSIPWYMFALAAYQSLMWLCRNINKKYLLVFSVILACFIGYDRSIGDYLYLSRIVVFFPIFLLGTMIHQQTITGFKSKYYRFLLPLAIVILALWFCLCFFKLDDLYIYRHLFTGRNPFSQAVIEYGPLARLLCYFITFLTGLSFIIILPTRSIPAVTLFGRRSLSVYFWHWPVYQLLQACFGINRLFEMSVWGKAAFLLAAVLLSYVLMAVRPFEYPLKLIKKLCFESTKDKEQQ
ncbi:MAG: acyltransferase family protein [Oscillospiraceae bacterium]|nr:acyltransferase family protein [Oscillospiraceae bacterium]